MTSMTDDELLDALFVCLHMESAWQMDAATTEVVPPHVVARAKAAHPARWRRTAEPRHEGAL